MSFGWLHPHLALTKTGKIKQTDTRRRLQFTLTLFPQRTGQRLSSLEVSRFHLIHKGPCKEMQTSVYTHMTKEKVLRMRATLNP